MENTCIAVNYNEFHLREYQMIKKCRNISICPVHVMVRYLLHASEVLYAATFILIFSSKRVELLIKPESISGLVCFIFPWRYNPLWLYFHSPVAGFSLLVFEVS